MAKKCKECKSKIENPYSSTQIACSPLCAILLAQKARAKEDKKKHKEMKEKIKTKGKWLQEAQQEFNKYIRKRDEGNSCISCGRSTGCKINAGHYRSVGACPELRFCEDNVHLQCEQCNCFKSGNAIDYRIGLIKKIGLDQVEWLEGPHDLNNYTIDDIKEIKARYKIKVKGML
ncbi:MAG: recombination protein NinG [Flavobacteriaceae bacterium]|nr:recombination protein NinG [Flavobacteriaceae bacterium]PCJ26467.1 MAG: protein NinG [Rickettsiales bacterium]